MTKPYQIGDYYETYQNFQLPVPRYYNWAFEVFDTWSKDPNKVAMVWVNQNNESRNITFSELGARSKQVANGLRGLGAEPGDCIFVMLPRVVEWWELVLACIRGKFVSVPGTTLLTTKDVAYRLNAARVKIVVTDEENVHKFETVWDECPNLETIIVVGRSSKYQEYETVLQKSSSNLANPRNLASDLLMIYFTSGTTGYPKMVMITHSSYPIGHISTGKFWLDNRPTDLHWTLSDTGWAQAAWSCLFGPWNMGAAIFIYDQRGKFDAGMTLNMLEKYPITTFFAPPTAYRMLVLEDLNKVRSRALRHCLGAGEPLNPEVIDVWREGTGHHIYEAYGQTETTLLICAFPGMQFKPGSMGVVAPGYQAAVIGDDGVQLPAGEEGEIAVKIKPEPPVGLFPGYWHNLEANNKCFRGDWYYTGDRATQDEDGYFWFVGRADDVIISASYRIGPFEVESALLEHPSVAEAAVIGVPNEIRGEIVKAFVVLTSGHAPSQNLVSDLQKHVRSVTAPYKYPREIEFTTELPKTISGKIRRTDLRTIELDKQSRKNPS